MKEKTELQPSVSMKEFWNNFLMEYRSEMQPFLNWLSEYKKQMNWNSLFSQGHRQTLADLPVAMQIGIFIQYCMETPHRYPLLECLPASMQAFSEHIQQWIAEEHEFASALPPGADDYDQISK